MLFSKIEKAGLPVAQVEWFDLDMSSMDSIRLFAKNVLDKYDSINLLINNGKIIWKLEIISEIVRLH